MNKWYKLGAKYGEKYSDQDFYNYILKNDLCNSSTTTVPKDFTESNYKELCDLLGLGEEIEEREYLNGERLYYFEFGFVITKLSFVQKERLGLSDEELVFELAKLQFELFQKLKNERIFIYKSIQDYDWYTIGTQVSQTYRGAVNRLYKHAKSYSELIDGGYAPLLKSIERLKNSIEFSDLKDFKINGGRKNTKEKELGLDFKQYKEIFMANI